MSFDKTCGCQILDLKKKQENQVQLLKQKQKSDEAAKKLQEEIQFIKAQKVNHSLLISFHSLHFISHIHHKPLGFSGSIAKQDQTRGGTVSPVESMSRKGTLAGILYLKIRLSEMNSLFTFF